MIRLLLILLLSTPMFPSLASRAETKGTLGRDSVSIDGSYFLPLVLSAPANAPPKTPSLLVPADGTMIGQGEIELRWSSTDPDGDLIDYDLYFERDDPAPDELIAARLTAPVYPFGEGELSPATYYWQVVAVDARGATARGPVWSFAVVGPEAYADAVVFLVNQERAETGCPPLAIDSRLTVAAERHSADMAANNFVSHTGSDGSTFGDRIRATGYHFSRAAENIAAGYPTPERVVAGWMASSGHRANILNCALAETGVGYVYLEEDPGQPAYRHYWTHDFATPASR